MLFHVDNGFDCRYIKWKLCCEGLRPVGFLDQAGSEHVLMKSNGRQSENLPVDGWVDPWADAYACLSVPTESGHWP